MFYTCRYRPEEHTSTGRYASVHGASVAATIFSKELKRQKGVLAQCTASKSPTSRE
jgi:hypothetical protein